MFSLVYSELCRMYDVCFPLPLKFESRKMKAKILLLQELQGIRYLWRGANLKWKPAGREKKASLIHLRELHWADFPSHAGLANMITGEKK